jgi:outer membrane receptor protein involved in Fe transport
VGIQAQTTGKIAGIVIDQSSDDPLPGANVFLEGTSIGAATELNGYFSIINVPPGLYTVNVQMIGYKNYQVRDLRVSVNRTAYVKAEMIPTILVGETVVVRADKIATKKDQTSSIRNVTSDQIEILPVENLESVVNLQAGVINGHFRGGRKNEVAYLIDGMQVVEAFDGESSIINLETEVVEELEVITGTFNAEYGRAMSGVVNAVTKDGSDRFHGAFSANFANYITNRDNIFIGLDNDELERQKDLKFQLSGPIYKDKFTFFLNVRSQDLNGYLNGINRFNVDDYSNFAEEDPSAWETYDTGDSSFVPINHSKLNSYLTKVSAFAWNNLKISLLFTRNDEEWRDYNHQFKYNPFGLATNHREANMLSFLVNHMLSNAMFYDLKLSYVDNYYGWYVFENPQDPGYVHDAYLNNNGPGFYTGGQQKDHTRQTTKDYNAKFDLNWQINKQHLFKSGVLFTQHDLKNEWHEIQNAYETREEDENFSYFDHVQQKRIFPYYEAVILGDSSIYTDTYQVRPFEFSLYIQDKMEFEYMVLNLGLRYDYFKPNSSYPSQRRNPANQLAFPDSPDKMSQYIDTDARYQLSPRLGLSYQLGSRAVLHFSYGHFFQMPPMYALYQNHSQRVAPNDYVTTMGNSQLEAQKSIQYEIGLWQELVTDLGLDVVVYYRDIYNLLSTKIVSTFNQIQYGLYTNKDYGNVKGLELKIDYTHGYFSTYLNYTLQFTRGNSDNPTQTFNREGDSRDPIPTLIPMSWDQRHTLNITVGYSTPDFGMTATAYYYSGTPYTWSPISENRVANINLYPNNSYQSSLSGVDLRGYYNFLSWNDIHLRLELSIYNLFDQLTDSWVDATTGRAYTSIVRESDLSSHHSNFNDFTDTYHDPSMFNPPRMVKLGLGVAF